MTEKSIMRCWIGEVLVSLSSTVLSSGISSVIEDEALRCVGVMAGELRSEVVSNVSNRLLK